MEEVLGSESRAGKGLRWQETPQDVLWVQASQRGDQVAFNRLVLKWESPVFNLVLRMLGNRHEAEDVTQEIFLAAYRSIRRFRGDACFSTWLYRIAVNKTLTCLRQRPRFEDAGLLVNSEDAPELPDGRGETQESGVLARERQEAVRRSLAALNPDQKVVVELKFFHDATFSEIASIIGEAESTVKSRFYKSLCLLKARLRRLGEEI